MSANMSRTVLDLLSYENPVLRHHIFWTSILVIKMLAMGLATGVFRFKTKSYANPEDVKTFNADIKVDEAVERIRRGHLNDMENILPYIFISFCYVLSDPHPLVALVLMWVVVGCRIWHTFVYAICVLPQPSRLLGFLIPCGVTIYMAVISAIKFCI